MKIYVIAFAIFISSSAHSHQFWREQSTYGPKAGCSKANQQKALNWIKNLAPEAYRIYLADKVGFMDPVWWSDCNDFLVDAAVVALHETVHGLSLDTQYPLIDGGQLSYLNDTGWMAPATIRSQFSEDRFTEIYLSLANDAATSGRQFSYLLDELNAYTHGLNLENRLSSHVTNRQWRSGAVAMMAYVAVYAKVAKQRHPTTWSRLQRDAAKEIVRTLWSQAERAVENSCQLPHPVEREDLQYLRKLCNPAETQALGEALAIPVKCHSACSANKIPSRTAFSH